MERLRFFILCEADVATLDCLAIAFSFSERKLHLFNEPAVANSEAKGNTPVLFPLTYSLPVPQFLGLTCVCT